MPSQGPAIHASGTATPGARSPSTSANAELRRILEIRLLLLGLCLAALLSAAHALDLPIPLPLLGGLIGGLFAGTAAYRWWAGRRDAGSARARAAELIAAGTPPESAVVDLKLPDRSGLDVAADAGGAPVIRPDPPSVARLEWEHIQTVLARHEGNISATARALKMHRRTLQRKLAKRPVAE